jgi:hypothetical protein
MRPRQPSPQHNTSRQASTPHTTRRVAGSDTLVASRHSRARRCVHTQRGDEVHSPAAPTSPFVLGSLILLCRNARLAPLENTWRGRHAAVPLSARVARTASGGGEGIGLGPRTYLLVGALQDDDLDCGVVLQLQHTPTPRHTPARQPSQRHIAYDERIYGGCDSDSGRRWAVWQRDADATLSPVRGAVGCGAGS